MAAWRYEISLLVLKKYCSTLEEKFRISARPCNILYMLTCANICSKVRGGLEKLFYKYGMNAQHDTDLFLSVLF